jgi:hypothetical protein
VYKILDDPQYRDNVLALSQEMGFYNAKEICTEFLVGLLGTAEVPENKYITS